MIIEKFIAPFIESQFPEFYREEGPLFVEFAKAYYQWMESEDNPTYHARRLLEHSNIDSTLAEFVKHFKDKYIASLPDNVVADQKLLIKHILELYRAKGTDKSYALLFRMIFNEDIELYIPSKNIFKLSDGEWIVPSYLEVSDSPYLSQLIGKSVYSSSTRSTAVVENFFTKMVNRKLINVLMLTGINGRFHHGEKLMSDELDAYGPDDAPIIFGSLSSISIVEGGIGFEVGDVVDVIGSGIGGKARISSVKNKNGEVTFELRDGGSGFSLDAIVSVDGRAINIVDVSNTSPVVVTVAEAHELESGQTVRVDFVQGPENINISTYTYYANVINSTSIGLYTNSGLSSPLNGLANPAYIANTGYVYINTGGTGATFNVGSITNKEIYRLGTDTIGTYENMSVDSVVSGYTLSVGSISGTFTAGHSIAMANVLSREADVTCVGLATNNETLSNASLGITNITVITHDNTYLIAKGSHVASANLVPGTVLVSNTSGAVLTINTLFPTSNISGTATIVSANSTALVVNNQSGAFLRGQTVTDTTSGATANVTSILRLTDWNFPAVTVPDDDNMDLMIGSSLTYIDKEVGTIASLKNLRTGSGYARSPVATIYEPLIYALRESDGNGRYKGLNAVVSTNAVNANGICTSAQVFDSGYGYERDQMLQLVNEDNVYVATGISVIDTNGVGAGYWRDNKSFISDMMYLQDSDYYQNYSYEIIATRMLATYEGYVKDLVHPTGMKLFGQFVVRSELSAPVSSVESSFVQS